MRYGLDAELVINTDGKTKLMREDITEWLEKLQPYIKQHRYEDYFASLQKIIDSGTSSERQKKVLESTGCFREVTKHNINEFIHQLPLSEYSNCLKKEHIKGIT
ncbi:hypothetical protein TUM19329_17450 [Legionella antarctica]|uniref:Uncharacterized protein n=1 Tax=Legionella antarctica TaxID=2708020 RepID=A0A6F8T3X2_9GAMM|nr:hypothetical protein TUM19329_17450 [Legionella antarctica]